MKVTKKFLKNLIKEELSKIYEQMGPERAHDPEDPEYVKYLDGQGLEDGPGPEDYSTVSNMDFLSTNLCDLDDATLDLVERYALSAAGADNEALQTAIRTAAAKCQNKVSQLGNFDVDGAPTLEESNKRGSRGIIARLRWNRGIHPIAKNKKHWP